MGEPFVYQLGEGEEICVFATIGVRSTEKDLDELLADETGYTRLQTESKSIYNVPLVYTTEQFLGGVVDYSNQHLLYRGESDKVPASLVQVLEFVKARSRGEVEKLVCEEIDNGPMYKVTTLGVVGVGETAVELEFNEWLKKLGIARFDSSNTTEGTIFCIGLANILRVGYDWVGEV